MKEIMQELERKSRDRPIELVSLKGQGKKIIEYYGDYIPEQWIKAAGAEGYLICKGGDPQAPEATLDYSLRFMNPLAASMVGNYLVGVDRVMPMADCVAIQQHDCHYGRMSEILRIARGAGRRTTAGRAHSPPHRAPRRAPSVRPNAPDRSPGRSDRRRDDRVRRSSR